MGTKKSKNRRAKDADILDMSKSLEQQVIDASYCRYLKGNFPLSFAVWLWLKNAFAVRLLKALRNTDDSGTITGHIRGGKTAQGEADMFTRRLTVGFGATSLCPNGGYYFYDTLAEALEAQALLVRLGLRQTTDKHKSLEQQVIDASYRSYLSTKTSHSFSEWLRFNEVLSQAAA